MLAVLGTVLLVLFPVEVPGALAAAFATKIRSMLNLLPFASASCACLLRAPKRRPPVEVRDVRELRDFAYRLVHPGRRCLCAGLGLGGVLVFWRSWATLTQ